MMARASGAEPVTNGRRRLLFALTMLCCALCIPVAVSAQSSEPSLGNLARELRAESAKQKNEPTHIYTNDDFPRASQPLTVTSTAVSDQAHPVPSATSESPQAIPGAKKHDEKYYRQAMRKLRYKLEFDQKSLAELKKEYDEVSTFGGFGPLSGVADISTFDIPFIPSRYEAKKADVAADQKAIAALQEQCRLEGCLPEWVRW